MLVPTEDVDEDAEAPCWRPHHGFPKKLLLTVVAVALSVVVVTNVAQHADGALEAGGEQEVSLLQVYDCPLVCGSYVPCLPDLQKLPLRRLRDFPPRRLGFEDGRRLGTYSCPNGCDIPDDYVNDNFCDCPEDCADEDDWTCTTCSIIRDKKEAVDVGVGVGVGVGSALALGIGLGAGLGSGGGLGAVLAVKGSMRLRMNDLTVAHEPNFARAMKDTVSRLAGHGVQAAYVELLIETAGLVRRLAAASWPLSRRLSEPVNVAFQIQVKASTAQDVCESLGAYDASTVQQVLREECLERQIDPQGVSVERYAATANPLSYNPLTSRGDSTYVPPESVMLG